MRLPLAAILAVALVIGCGGQEEVAGPPTQAQSEQEAEAFKRSLAPHEAPVRP